MVLDVIAQGIAKTSIKSIHKTNESIIQRAERMSKESNINYMYTEGITLIFGFTTYLISHYEEFQAQSNPDEMAEFNHALYQMYTLLSIHFHKDMEFPQSDNIEE